MKPIDAGDLAWLLTSSAMVMLMVPGLALFYGGMVRPKNVLSTMMHSMVALAIVGAEWALVGYALAFGKDLGGGLLGWDSRLVLLSGVQPWETWPDTGIPIYVHAMYQGMFAIITPALISGALAERIRFGPYCLFVALWGLLVYAPLAHWVWHHDGWLAQLGALDFAGGTVVHVAAGLSALTAIFLVRPRDGYPARAVRPASAANTLFGAGLLWFGWFGFNGGSALAANASAALAMTDTHIAAATGGLTWLVVEWQTRKKPTAIGFASGAVAGLVGITPAAGYVGPASALVIGALVGLVCFHAVMGKTRLGYDDSLDAFGIHGVGGALGALLTGVFASKALYGANAGGGWLADGNPAQVVTQAIGIGATALLAVPMTFAIVKGVELVAGGFAVASRAEEDGLDESLHGEPAYDFAPDGGEAMSATEPRSARLPPAIATCRLDVEGLTPEVVASRWDALCREADPPAAFRVLYPHVARRTLASFRLVGLEADRALPYLEQLFPSARVAVVTRSAAP